MADHTKPVFLVVLGQTTDRPKMTNYSEVLFGSGLYPANGGYYAAFGQPLEMFEGDWPNNQAIVIARFPSHEHAKAFWYSDLYQNKIKPLRTGAGTFAVSVHEELSPPSPREATGSDGVIVERNFLRLPHGQLHFRTAAPRDAKAAVCTPVILLHQSPKSGKQMVKLMTKLASDRVCYAPDFPGFGDSDPPLVQPEIKDYAAAIGALIDHLRLATVDLYGYHTGVLSAVELAIARPKQVRRLVFVGLPLLIEVEREAIRSHPWPLPIEASGSHLTAEWTRSMQWAGPGQMLPDIAEGFLDKLKAGPTGHWGAKAAISYRLQDTLPKVTQPILAIGPKDDLWTISPRCEALMQTGTFTQWPEYGFGVMDVATDKLVAVIKTHLDAA